MAKIGNLLPKEDKICDIYIKNIRNRADRGLSKKAKVINKTDKTGSGPIMIALQGVSDTSRNLSINGKNISFEGYTNGEEDPNSGYVKCNFDWDDTTFEAEFRI